MQIVVNANDTTLMHHAHELQYGQLHKINDKLAIVLINAEHCSGKWGAPPQSFWSDRVLHDVSWQICPEASLQRALMQFTVMIRTSKPRQTSFACDLLRCSAMVLLVNLTKPEDSPLRLKLRATCVSP